MDKQSPNNTVKYIGIMVVLVVCVVGGIVALQYYNSTGGGDGDNANALTRPIKLPESISIDYFKTFEKDPTPQPIEQPDSVVKQEVTQQPKAESQPTPPIIEQPAPVVVEQPPEQITTADIFEPAPVNKLALAQQNYLQTARGNVSVQVYNHAQQTYHSPYAVKDKDWTPQGVAKSVSSLPVDMSRTITADKFIEAVLINAIDSSLGGKVIAQINHNVYGGHGNKILIPIGSRAVGYYEPINKIGKERLGIVWERIITPLGVNIIISDAEGADGMGRAGITGLVDNRSWDRYGVALLTSTINALAILKIPSDNQQQQALINTYGKDLSQLGAKILEETMQIKPRILVKAGTIVTISIRTDIWIHPPKRSTAILEATSRATSKTPPPQQQGNKDNDTAN